MQAGETTAAETRSIVAVLLAAGRSERFAGDKLAAPLTPGENAAPARTLGQVSADTLVAAAATLGMDVLIVSSAARLPLWAGRAARVLLNPEPAAGLSASIRLAVAATPAAGGWLFLPADLPGIAQATIEETARRLAADGRLVRPAVQGVPGHPVGIPARYRDELLALTGDEGARPLLARHAADLDLWPSRDAGAVRDVDSRADLAALRRSPG